MIFIFFSLNLKKIVLSKIKQILDLFLYLSFFSCSIQWKNKTKITVTLIIVFEIF